VLLIIERLPTQDVTGGGGYSWSCVVFAGTSGGTSSFELHHERELERS